MSYILITPIKNEFDNIDDLKYTVLNQSVRPLIWVIIDGKSTDNGYEKCVEVFKEYSWIHIIKQKIFYEKGYSHKNFAQAMNEALEYIYNNFSNIDYSYIAKVDSTIKLSRTYFEKLIVEIENDPKLGVVCGQGVELGVKNIIKNPDIDEMIYFNDIRIYRKEIFKFFKGYPLTPSPDIILLLYIKNAGYKIKKVVNANYIDTRIGATKIGNVNGFILKGIYMNQLNYNPVLILYNIVFATIQYNVLSGVSLLIGYIISNIRLDKRIDNKIIINYFRYYRVRVITKKLFKYFTS